MKTTLYIIGVIMLLLTGIIGYQASELKKGEKDFGSVSRVSEYHATSSSSVLAHEEGLIQTDGGTLGSVIVTLAGDLEFQLLNATTTNITARGGKATSTIVMAEIPASLVAGTYTFDTIFTDGLYLDVTAGTMGTSTITFR